MSRCIHVAGDSTACDYPSDLAPRTGWAQVLGRFVAGCRVRNLAQSGRSTKSYIDEGWWRRLKDGFSPGDCLILQFGHNDQKSEDPSRFATPFGAYQDNLRRMSAEAREAGAAVVLCSPIERRRFGEGGLVVPTHGDYPRAAAELAAGLDLPFVDLTALSAALWQEAGEEGSRRYFLHTAAGEYPAYPDGVADDTHLSERGALAVAALFADAVRRGGFEPAGCLAEPGDGRGR